MSIANGNRKFNLLITSLSCVSFLSVCAVGYSVWSFSGGSTQVNVPVVVATNSSFSYGKTAYYINGSESGFDYYIFDGQYYFTKTSYSLKFKVSPVLLLSSFQNSGEVLLNFSLSYESDSFDMFSAGNTNADAPSFARYYLDTQKSNQMTSMSVEVKTEGSLHTISSSIYLYSDTMPSLYSMTKDYSASSTTYVYLWASFDFDIKDTFSASAYESIAMRMSTSVNGAAS